MALQQRSHFGIAGVNVEVEPELGNFFRHHSETLQRIAPGRQRQVGHELTDPLESKIEMALLDFPESLVGEARVHDAAGVEAAMLLDPAGYLPIARADFVDTST
jgi:hypothetical protein